MRVLLTDKPAADLGAPARDRQLKITEIFHSLQGESTLVGLPTVFVRLTGCPLRCRYCDTEYAFHGGQWRGFDAIIAEIQATGCQRVCVTGGEPLAQKRCAQLLTDLCDLGLVVSLETSGAMDVSAVDPRVIIVLDLKTPDSGEQGRNLPGNFSRLKSGDQLKAVICSRADFDWAVSQIRELPLANDVEVLFSPSYGQVEPAQLAQWILGAKIDVRFQLQLHKILWGDKTGV